MMATTNMSFAATIAVPARPPNPSVAAIKAMTRKPIAQLNMAGSFVFHAPTRKRAAAHLVPVNSSAFAVEGSSAPPRGLSPVALTAHGFVSPFGFEEGGELGVVAARGKGRGADALGEGEHADKPRYRIVEPSSF